MATTRISDLITIASRITGMTPAQIVGPQRHKPIARVRQAVAYVAAEQGKHSLTQIGRMLNRDHTTISHARNMVPEFMKRDADLRLLVEQLFIESERHDPYALRAQIVNCTAVIHMPPTRRSVPAPIPRDDERQGAMDKRDMATGSRLLLQALLAV